MKTNQKKVQSLKYKDLWVFSNQKENRSLSKRIDKVQVSNSFKPSKEWHKNSSIQINKNHNKLEIKSKLSLLMKHKIFLLKTIKISKTKSNKIRFKFKKNKNRLQKFNVSSI